MRRTSITFAIILALLCGALWASAQQDSQKAGETLTPKVLRAPNSAGPPTVEYPAISVTTPDQAPKLDRAHPGHPVKLTRQVATVLAYTITWGGGHSTIPGKFYDPQVPVFISGTRANVAAYTVKVTLPAHGFKQTSDTTVDCAEVVLDGAKRAATFTLSKQPDGTYRVAGITAK
jgi:hypothetical protein